MSSKNRPRYFYIFKNNVYPQFCDFWGSYNLTKFSSNRFYPKCIKRLFVNIPFFCRSSWKHSYLLVFYIWWKLKKFHQQQPQWYIYIIQPSHSIKQLASIFPIQTSSLIFTSSHNHNDCLLASRNSETSALCYIYLLLL